jgi:hypothetical protein
MTARAGGWIVFRIQIETTPGWAHIRKATNGGVRVRSTYPELLAKCSGRFGAKAFRHNRLAALLTYVADANVDDKGLRARRRWW